MIKTLLFFLFALLLAFQAQAQIVPKPIIAECVRPNGKKIKAVEVIWKASSTPTPTATPKPTVVTQCGDGFFNHDENANTMYMGVPKFGGRHYEPGKVYHMCADVPDSKRLFFELKSVNHSNGVCNLYSVWLVAPDGTTQMNQKVQQPGIPGMYQKGRWQVVVILDPTKENLCGEPKGLSMTMQGF